jgi:hypothetical protein
MSWTKIWTASLGSQFGLDINTFLKENTFQQRILVPQHQTLVGCRPVSGLETVEIRFMGANSLF